MKRGDAEVAPAHLERVRRTPQWGCSRRCEALSQGGTALPCLVKMNLLSRPLGAAHAAMPRRCQPVPLLYVVQTAFGRVVERGRVKCA